MYQCWDELTTTVKLGKPQSVSPSTKLTGSPRVSSLLVDQTPSLPEAPTQPPLSLSAKWSQEPRSHLHVHPTALLPSSSHTQAFRFLLQGSHGRSALFPPSQRTVLSPPLELCPQLFLLLHTHSTPGVVTLIGPEHSSPPHPLPCCIYKD